MSSLHTNTIINIGTSLKISSFEHLKIEQSITGHHSFELVLSQEWLKEGEGLFNKVKDLIGKEILIKMTPELATDKNSLVFEGIITNISTGKQDNGINGFCIISGYSPTILLDDDLNIQTFEDKDLQTIVKDRLKKYPQNLLKSTIEPKSSTSFGYIVQYKENTWNFIRRLASSNGEWCFYDGSKLVYGKHDPREITLLHHRDLSSFTFDMGIKPGNQKMHSYEYETDQPLDTETISQNTGTLNHISDHMLKLSDSLFTQQGLVKMNQQMDSATQEHLKNFALMQRKSRIAQMVYARGESTNLSVQVGAIINIKEDFQTNADHGKYFVTNVTHVCSGNGNYTGFFNSIPSDAAAPAYYQNLYSLCEAQSAVVMENYDPKGLGRIRVRFRWQDYGMSPWIRLVLPSGGANKGSYFIPEKGEEVWVDFEGGNAELPFVIGSIYNEGAKSTFGNASNDFKVIKTRSGHMIEMNDAGSGTSITIKDINGNTIFLDTIGKNITITAPETMTFNAKNLVINVGENMTTEVGADMKTTVAANHKLTISKKHEISSAETIEKVNGDKASDVKGDLVIKTGMTKLNAVDGDIIFKSVGVAHLHGVSDAKVNRG